MESIAGNKCVYTENLAQLTVRFTSVLFGQLS
jgi:hypothetical protein